MCSTMALSTVMTSMHVLQGVVGLARNNADAKQYEYAKKQQALKLEQQAMEKERSIKMREQEKNRELLGIEQQSVMDKSRARLLAASSGVDLSSTSVLDVLLDNTAKARADSLYARKKAAYDIHSLASDASMLRTDAKNARLAGKDNRSALEKSLEVYDVTSPLLSIKK